MKIIDLKTYVVGNPWKNWIFVQLFTDEGITGFGEATGGLATKPNLGDVEELRPLLIGEDPCHPERVWLKLIKARALHRSTGISAVEQACWDILAKSLDVPMWRLFGGKHHPRLRVYANGWYQGPRDPVFFAEKAAEMVSRGYTALKFDPFGGAYQQIDRDSERLAIAIVRAMRETLGDDVDLLIEAHDRFTVSTAIRLGRQLEEFRPFWMETPVRTYDLQGHIEVQRALSFPVVLGEAFTELRQFAELLHERVIDIVQPEPQQLGPSTARKAFAVAEAYGALVACHQAQSPFCTAMNAHLHCSIPNFLIQENFDDSLEPWTWDLLQGVPRVEDGYLVPSDAPGWGVELNEEEARKHPYGERNFLRLFEEGWETRRPPTG
ncbi:MAG TPA: mandelate racemase/muconate lactonizing enzyme family protein [Chloroflexi bacterium]|jgi:galactonate dehydratase|nr:mandelate racemase/muconate lactonizing enzyme family protein [Chloroflexota bacterium]